MACPGAAAHCYSSAPGPLSLGSKWKEQSQSRTVALLSEGKEQEADPHKQWRLKKLLPHLWRSHSLTLHWRKQDMWPGLTLKSLTLQGGITVTYRWAGLCVGSAHREGNNEVTDYSLKWLNLASPQFHHLQNREIRRACFMACKTLSGSNKWWK